MSTIANIRYPKSLKTRALLTTASALVLAGIIPGTAKAADVAANAVWEVDHYQGGTSATRTENGDGNVTFKANGDRAIAVLSQKHIGRDAQVNLDAKLFVAKGQGADPMKIMGRLNSNGEVILIDPNGVMFGKDSIVDVGSIMATSGDILNEDLLDGDGRYTITNLDGRGAIENHGMISVADAGIAAFVAPNISNSGIINAKLGKVAFAAGDKVTLDLYGDNLVEIAVDDKVADALIENSGTINAEGGMVVMTAQAAKDAVDSVINTDGIIEVSSVTQQGGKIILSGGAQGKVTVAGAAKATGTTGGKIEVSGQTVELASTAELDASGDFGGGQINVGGDFQGVGDIQASDLTIVQDGAVIRNDALIEGDGGETIFWSDGITAFDGAASARGGANGGNGGLVEISGLSGLLYQGTVDTTAVNGATGTLLFDPRDIDFRVGDRGGDTTDLAAIILDYLDGDIDYFDLGAEILGGSTFRIYESDVEATSLLTDIIMRSRRSFTVSDGANVGASDGVITIANGNDLLIETLNTGNFAEADNAGTIDLTGSATYGSGLTWKTSGAGNITINAATADDQAGDIILSKLQTETGDINISTNNGSIKFEGDVTTAGGNVNADAASSDNKDSRVAAHVTMETNGGDINFAKTGLGRLIIAGTLDADSGDVTLSNENTLHFYNSSAVTADQLSVTGGRILQALGSQITAQTLTGESGDEAEFLSADNDIVKIGDFEVGTVDADGHFTLVDTNGVEITGTLASNGGDIDVTTVSDVWSEDLKVAASGAVTSMGGDIDLTNNGPGRLIVAGTVDARGSLGNVTLTSGGDMQFWNGSDVYADVLTTVAGQIWQQAGSVIEAETLTGMVEKYAEFLGTGNKIGTLGDFAVGTAGWYDDSKGFTLVDSEGGLIIAGDVTSTGGDIDIDTTSSVWSDDLKVNGDASVASMGGDIDLTNNGPGRLIVHGTIDARGSLGDVTLSSGGDMQFWNGSEVYADTLDVTAGQIQQWDGSTIEAETLTGTTLKFADFLGLNNKITTLGDFSVGTAAWYDDSKGFTLVDSEGGLIIAGDVTSTGGDIDIDTTSSVWSDDLKVNGDASVASMGGDIDLTNNGPGRLIVAGTVDARGSLGNVTLTSGGDMQFWNGSDVYADVLTTVAGQIWQQAGSVIEAETLTGMVEKYAEFLGTGNKIGTLGDFSVGTAGWYDDSKGFTLVDSEGGLDIDGQVTSTGGDIEIDTVGDLAILSGADVDADGGDIDLFQTGIFSSVDADTLHTSGTGTITTYQNDGGDIQDNIDAVDNSGTGLNTIYVGAGDYTAINVYEDNFLLSGNNAGVEGWSYGRAPESTIHGASPAVTITSNNVTLDGFEILGGNPGVKVDGGDDVTIRNNNIHGQTGSLTGNGIYAYNSDDLLIERNWIHDTDNDGIHIVYGDRADIFGNYLSEIGDDAVDVYDNDHIEIADNGIYNTDGRGLEISQSYNADIRGNYIDETDSDAIFVEYSNKADIYGNYINTLVGGANTGGDGIQVENSSEVEINNNVIDDISSDAIELSNTDYVSVYENVITDAYRGIHLLDSGTYDADIDNNRITNVEYGIYADDVSKLNIEDNRIDGSTSLLGAGEIGIYVKDSYNARIGGWDDGNYVESFTTGIKVKGSESADIEYNDVTKFGYGGGIYVDDSKYVDVIKNDVWAGLGHGIKVEDSRYAEVNWNEVDTILGLGSHGIYIDNGDYADVLHNEVNGVLFGNGINVNPSDYVYIAHNLVEYIGGDGISVEGGVGADIRWNTISHVGSDGIQLDNTDYVTVYDNKISDAYRGVHLLDSGIYDANIDNNKIKNVEYGIYADDVSKLNIEDNYIDGSTSSYGSGTIGIYVDDSYNARIGGWNDGNYVEDFNTGIYVEDSTSADIEYNDVTQFGYGGGIYVDDSNYVDVIGNDVWKGLGHGIKVEDSKHAEVNWNDVKKIYGYGSHGIYIDNGDYADVMDNEISDVWYGNGINVNPSDYVNIIDNLVEYVGGNGIAVDGGIYADIEDNTVRFTGDDGIDVEGNFGVDIKWNKISFTGDDGIDVEDSDYADIKYNKVSFTDGDGVEVERSKFVDIVSNLISFTGDDGIDVERSKFADIKFNKISFTDGDGIEVEHSKFANIVSNLISFAGDDGIDVEHSKFADIIGNVVGFVRNNGIEVEHSKFADVKFNTVNFTGGDGIYARRSNDIDVKGNFIGLFGSIGDDGIHISGSDRAFVDGNIITNTAENGIHFNPSDDGVISNNVITSAGADGILVEKGNNVTIRDNTSNNNAGDGIEVAGTTGTITIDGNTLTENGVNGVYISGKGNGTIILTDNSFTNNPTGFKVESGRVDLTGPGNRFVGGNVGIHFSTLDNDIQLIDNDPTDIFEGTLGSQIFDGQSQFFVKLEGNALYEPGQPSIYNALNSFYRLPNGVLFSPSSTNGVLTQTQFDFLNGMFFEYFDGQLIGQNLGQFFFGFVPTDDLLTLDNIEDFFREYGAVPGGPGEFSLTITSLPFATPPSANQLAGISTFAGGGEGGEMTPEQLANLEPAAGGGDTVNCWGDAANSLDQGVSITYQYGSDAQSTMAAAAACGATQ